MKADAECSGAGNTGMESDAAIWPDDRGGFVLNGDASGLMDSHRLIEPHDASRLGCFRRDEGGVGIVEGAL